MTPGAESAVAVFVGLVLGSFATALAFRLPRGISLFSAERSRCPSCGHTLSALDLVPLLSWLCLRGKCRHCACPIGLRYPLIELATLALCLLFAKAYGVTVASAPLFAAAPILVAMFDIDLRYRIIPDGLNLALLLAGILALGLGATGAEHFMQTLGAALGGLLLYGGGALALRQAGMLALKREALGLGDVKLYAAAGFWLGLNVDAAVLFLIVSGLLGVAFTLGWKKKTGQPEAPFAPPLILAFIVALCLYPTGLIPS